MSPEFPVSREQRRQLARDSMKYSYVLSKMHPMEYQHISTNPMPIEVWRSRRFLVQVFAVRPTITRLSINRIEIEAESNRWEQGISWEELQRIKREVGFGEYDAVEIFPADKDIVNVANMRHLWVLQESLDYKWSNTPCPK